LPDLGVIEGPLAQMCVSLLLATDGGPREPRSEVKPRSSEKGAANTDVERRLCCLYNSPYYGSLPTCCKHNCKLQFRPKIMFDLTLTLTDEQLLIYGGGGGGL
jgi:hypothetical protein